MSSIAFTNFGLLNALQYNGFSKYKIKNEHRFCLTWKIDCFKMHFFKPYFLKIDFKKVFTT